MDPVIAGALIGGGAGLLAGVGGLLTGLANYRESRRTNNTLNNGFKTKVDLIETRTELFEVWMRRHEIQHGNNDCN